MKYPGSNWWSFDFHNHTPASSDYDAGERAAITARDWLLAYMRSGVDCVAITDHNAGDWIDILKQELITMAGEQPRHAEFRDIHLFPGAELTSSEGLHILAIYGPEDGAAKIHGLLALSQYNHDANNAHGICNAGASAICDHIHQTGGVVILAHAEEVNGIFHGSVDVATGNFIPTRPDRSIEQILEKADAIEIHNEGSRAAQHFADRLKSRAIVDGSDSHRTSRAGTRRVWIKMAQPSIEGLKLALLDPASSLLRATDKPSAPLHRITSLRIEQLHLRRQPLEIAFSPWFNAIIGGRGSGKSTMLEALRLAMAREVDISELGTAQESDVVRAFERFRTPGGVRGNSGMVRQDTILTATVEKYDPSANTNEMYLFTWKPDGFRAQRLDAGVWQDTGLSIEQAAKSFPVKIFSQKQIFELAERPSALLTYIDRTPEVGFQVWKERYDELCRSLRKLRSQERVLLQTIEKKAELETELREVSRKTLAYQQSNIAGQVKVYQENQQAEKEVNGFIDALLGPIRKLDEALEEQSPYAQVRLGEIALKIPDPSSVQKEAVTLASELDAKYTELRQIVANMQQHVEQFQRGQVVADYFQKTGMAIAAYRDEVTKLRDQGIGTAQEAETALKRKQELEAALAQIVAQQTQLEVLQKQLIAAYARLKLHRRKLTKLRRKFVNDVLASNPNLRITIDEQADVEQSSDDFRSILRLQEGTFIEDVLSLDEVTGQKAGLLGNLVAHGLIDPTHKRVTSLKSGILERSREILGQPVHGRLVTAIGRLSPDDFDTLLEWFPHDLVKVEFRRGRHENFQSLERASAGQKTSSVLSFLLAHGEEPLLLDQPEDDLDNGLVSELVVNQIRNNKSRRQIIVVTHNPNIVVNGDAELVLPMMFSAGQIQQNDAGGLQERAVRERICNIMEGGRDAFRQRYKRILEDLDASV